MHQTFNKSKNDYMHLQKPTTQQLEQDGTGFVRAYVGEALPPLTFSSLIAMPSFLKSETARAFIRAYRRSLDWVNDTSTTKITNQKLPMFSSLAKDALVVTISRYQQLKT